MKIELQAQALTWTAAAPFWMQVQTLFLFFPLQEALRLIFVRRKLFASGRNAMCLALPGIFTNSSQHNIAQWLALCNVCIWDISVLWPEKSQLNPSLDLHGRAPCKGNHPLWGLPGHSFLGADHPDTFTPLQVFPPGDENPFWQSLPFCPLGDTSVVSQLGASSSHQFVTNPGTTLSLREQGVLVSQDIKGRKEGGGLAGPQEWGRTWQWNSGGGFMFVSWSWAQGPCCRSRSRECLIVSSFSSIPTPLPQSFAVLRGWEFGSAVANNGVFHSKHSWVLVREGRALWWKCFDLHKALATPFLLLSWLPFPRWMDMPQGTITDGLQRRNSVKQKTEGNQDLRLILWDLPFLKGD